MLTSLHAFKFRYVFETKYLFLLPGSLSRSDTKNKCIEKCILENWLFDCYITSNEFHSHIYIILDNEMLKS